MEEYPFFDDTFGHGSGLMDLSPRAMRSMVRPFSVTSSIEFIKYWEETLELLKRLFQTKNDIVGMVGSIRVAFDSIISSIMEPGDKVLLLTTGYWGDYPAEIIKVYGGEPIVLKEKPELVISPEKLSKKLDEFKNLKAVIVVHVETDTGAVNPVQEIGKVVKEKTNALYIVDCATSLGGMEVKADEWGADVCFSGSHKCLSAPVGLALIAVNEKTWETMEKRKIPIRSFYTSLLTWKSEWLDRVRGKCYSSFPASTVYAIRTRLDQIFEDGLEKEYKRHEIAARAIRLGLMEMGFNMFLDCGQCKGCDSPRKFCSDVVTAARFPPKVSDKWEEFGSLLKHAYNTNIGVHSFGRCGFGKCFHVGTVGPRQLLPRNILGTLTAIGLAMSDLGAAVKLEEGLREANMALNELRVLIKK